MPEPYSVELLYEFAPLLTPAEVAAKLTERCGSVEPGTGDGLVFGFPAYGEAGPDGVLPVQVSVEPHVEPLDDPALEKALSQTWDWREARAVADGHGAYVTLSDRLRIPLEYRPRLGLFQNVLQGLMELAMPGAILWRPSGKVVNPVALTRALRPGEARDALRGAANVRRFKSQDRPGRMLMDTLGLSAIGLPDFEAAFEGVDPARMEAVLLSLARYEYDLGDVIAVGRVVKVPGSETPWVCTRGPSKQKPEREVIRLVPGKPAP
jgi:hypothetical protein